MYCMALSWHYISLFILIQLNVVTFGLQCFVHSDCYNHQYCDSGTKVCTDAYYNEDTCQRNEQCVSNVCINYKCAHCSEKPDNCHSQRYCGGDKSCYNKRNNGEWCDEHKHCKSNTCYGYIGRCLRCTKDADCQSENDYCDSDYCHKKVGYNQVCDAHSDCHYLKYCERSTKVCTKAFDHDETCNRNEECRTNVCSFGTCQPCSDEPDNCPSNRFCSSDRNCYNKNNNGEQCVDNMHCKSNICNDFTCLKCNADADCQPKNDYCYSDYCHKKVGYNEVCDHKRQCKSNICGTSTVSNTCGCNAHSHCPMKHICNVSDNTCKEKNCSALQSFANGSAEYQNPSKRYDDKPVGFNDSLAIKCSPGYKFSTNETKCELNDDNSTVYWTTIPLCYSVCSKLNKSVNGKLLYQNTTLLYDDTKSSNLSETVVQKCNVGFRLNGTNSTTTCSQPDIHATADWSPKLDTCQALNCSALPRFANGSAEYQSTSNPYDDKQVPFNQTLGIKCSPGYESSNSQIKCGVNPDNTTVAWTSTPLCYAVCGKLNLSVNGTLIYQDNSPYDNTNNSNLSVTVVQKCDVGFRLNGSNSATTCSQPDSNSRADWAPKLDTCKVAAKCQPLPLKENMKMSIERTNYDGLSSVEYSSTITITCDPDFDFVGKNQSITCNLNIENTVNWTSTSYDCKPSTRPNTFSATPESATQANKCAIPEVNRFTQLNFTNTTQYNGTMEMEQHTVILVSCVKGYKLGGPGVVKCVDNNGSGKNAWNKTVRGCNEEWPWANFNHNLSWLGDYLIDERKKSDGSSTCLSFLSILLSLLAFTLTVVL